MGDNIHEFNDENFEDEVIEADGPVLVDFWAPWCGPCRMITPIIEELAAENGESVKFGKVNIDENGGTAQAYGVSSIPTLIVFSGGQPVSTLVGLQPKKRIQEVLDEAKA